MSQVVNARPILKTVETVSAEAVFRLVVTPRTEQRAVQVLDGFIGDNVLMVDA
jgi:hypothetical protein